MQKPVDTGRGENPASPKRLERELLIGTHLRGGHYGQRSFVPHQQVEHMATPTSFVRLQFALAKGEPFSNRGLAVKAGLLASRSRSSFSSQSAEAAAQSGSIDRVFQCPQRARIK